jgi:sterol desaturase/sphingolipid hydroxylase (fatty acid hydroxylase superfamily)
VGLPVWAVIADKIFRNYYGYFIHADLPWTYGPLGKVFVSPAMHRWHHAKDYKYAGTNFATVFSIFDRVFGTFALPGPCDVPVGIEQDIGNTVPRQLAHPFREWFRAFGRRKAARGPEAAP